MRCFSLVSLLTLFSCAQITVDEHAESTTFRDCRQCPEMVVVPGGSYLKGSPQDEPGRSDDSRNHDEDDVPGPGGVAGAGFGAILRYGYL
jgi:formylglycine-generating enzyme required for sulfatase activity